MIQQVGYFKVWRELFTKPIWLNSTPEQKAILFTLLSMANFGEKQWEWQGKKFAVKPGQFITSLESIVKKCGKGIAIQNVRTSLVRFEKLEFLTNEPTKTGRLITIVNWHLYQSDAEEPNKEPNKDLTKTSQRANKELTPREEGKKDKEGKEVKIFIPPTPEEVKIYCSERKNQVDPVKFHDFYSSKGWMVGKNKMKDWQASVRTWESDNKKQDKQNKVPQANNFEQRKYDDEFYNSLYNNVRKG